MRPAHLRARIRQRTGFLLTASQFLFRARVAIGFSHRPATRPESASPRRLSNTLRGFANLAVGFVFLWFFMLSRIRRLLKASAPFSYSRGTRALSGIGLRRVRSWEVTTSNPQFANFRRGCKSRGNWSNEMPTAALDRRSAMRRSRNRRQRVRRRIRCSFSVQCVDPLH
jgi:hypothetical protein